MVPRRSSGSPVRPGRNRCGLSAVSQPRPPGLTKFGRIRDATGRPSLPADLVGAVLVLKELHDLSDVQTADALKFDIRWKVACGRSLTQVSFDPSVLVYWRRRIAACERPDRVSGAVAEVIAQTGVLRGRRKRCVDSTVFDDAVSTQDTVTQLVAAIRRVARVVPGAAEVVAGA